MALRYLLDTSVLKRLRRGYFARDASEWDELVTALDAFVRVDTTAAHVRRALQVQRQLAERSQRGRKIPDLLIAATAEDLKLAVLHYDSDYDLIATVTGQVCAWVAPAGTVE